MATPLETAFFTDEHVVAQGDVTFMGRAVESLVMKFNQAKYEESSLLVPRALGCISTARSPQRSILKSLLRLL